MTKAGNSDTAPTHSLFDEPWWLDALTEGTWREAVVESGGRVIGRLPYVPKKRFGMTVLTQPPLTQALGPWVDVGQGSTPRRLATEKRVMGELIEQLPRHDAFLQNFSPQVMNVMPFLWAGFTATVQYTYRLDDLTDMTAIWKGFREEVRRNVRNAEKRLTVEIDPPIDSVLGLNARSFARQGIKSPYSENQIRQLDAACAAHDARRIFAAVDASGRMHAFLYLVWDDRTSFAILNGRDEDVAGTAANALLFWEAIRFASEVTQTFDFEGSMIKPIEHFLRAFGGRQTLYFRVHKARWLARAGLAIQDAANRRAVAR